MLAALAASLANLNSMNAKVFMPPATVKILSISFQRGRGTRLTRKRFGDDIARHNGSQVGEEIPKLLLGDAIRQIAEKDRAAVVILVQGSLRCAWGGNRIRRLALDFGSWNNAELLVVAHELCTVSK